VSNDLPWADRGLTPVTVIAGGHEAAVLAARLALGLRDGVCPEQVAVVAEAPAPEPVGEIAWHVVRPLEGSRTEGCDCCRVRLDLVGAIRLVLERPTPPQRVLVVASESSDVSTIAQTLLSEPAMQRLVDLDGVVATVDAVARATRVALGLPFDDEMGLARLAVADRVLVSRADDLTDDALGTVMRSLRTINRFGFIAAPAVSPIDMSAIVDLRAWHGAPPLGSARMVEPVVVADGTQWPVTVRCELDGFCDADAVDEWFDHLIAQLGSRLLRLQGAVAVDGHEHRVCCRGVRSFAISHSETEHRADERSPLSIVAVVGYGLDADAVRAEFEATRAR